MTNTTKQAEWPDKVKISFTEKGEYAGIVWKFAEVPCKPEGGALVTYIRADLVKPIQAEPVAWLINWFDKKVPLLTKELADVKTAEKNGFKTVPLYTADTVRALQLEAIRKTLEVAKSRILDDHGKVQSPLYQLRQIDPEEILKGLTP